MSKQISVPHSHEGKVLDTRGRCDLCRHERYMRQRKTQFARNKLNKILKPEAYGRQLESGRLRWREVYSKDPLFKLNVTSKALQKNYGITLDQYTSILIAQENHCAICPRKPLKKRRLAVDHSHSLKKGDEGFIRGLLCTRCNTVLGLLRDNPQFLDNMEEYLRG